MVRGEIWLINLEPTIGAEIKKIRPAVIVNNDNMGILPLKVIVPVTDWKEHYIFAPWMVYLNNDNETNLDKPSVADTFQIRSVAEERFIRKIGKIDKQKMKEITKALSVVLKIN